MEVSLVTSERVDFKRSLSSLGWHFMEGTLSVKLGGKTQQAPSSAGSSMLEKSLAKRCTGSTIKRLRQDSGQELSLQLNVMIAFGSLSSRSFIKVFNDTTQDGLFARLERTFGGLGQLSFQMELKLLGENVDESTRKFVANGARAGAIESMNKEITGTGLVQRFEITDDVFQKWKEISKISGELSIRLKMNDAAFQALQMDNLEDSFSTCRAIRADVGSTDALIIAGGGAEIRCHKGFLSAHSPVFKAMFESSMKEGTTGTVYLSDMTEAGVQTLLDYLYCWDIQGICKSSAIALELLVAADKYNIPRLQSSLEDLMLLKPNGWFTIPVAIQLLQFVKNRAPAAAGGAIDHAEGQQVDQIYKRMEAKGIAVLKSKSPDELKECPEFQQLFEDPKSAMEFCIFAMLYPVSH